MSRLDIRIKAGTKVIVDYGDGMTITHELFTDTDIDYLYDTLGRLEEIERVDRDNRTTDRYDDFCPTCDAPEPTHTPTCAVVHRATDREVRSHRD